MQGNPFKILNCNTNWSGLQKDIEQVLLKVGFWLLVFRTLQTLL